MEDKAFETEKRAQSGPRQEMPAWLRPLLRVWPAIGGRPNAGDEEEKGDPGIRLTYDLKDTLTDNRFVGLWRMATGFRKIYILAVIAAGLALSEDEFEDLIRTGGELGPDHLFGSTKISPDGLSAVYAYLTSLE